MSLRNRRIPLLVAALGILALGVVITARYTGSEHSSTLPSTELAGHLLNSPSNLAPSSTGNKQLPRPVTRQSYSELLAKAQQGDAPAATRVFHDMKQCYEAKAFLIFAEHNGCNNPVDPETEKACSAQNQDMPSRIRQAKDNAAACESVPAQDFESMRYQATMSAAKLGDADAQACAMSGEFDLRKLPTLSDQDREQYEVAAMSYADSFFASGDWRAVQVQTPGWQAYTHAHKLKFSSTQGDEIAIYRMLALLRYGATGSYADSLDARLMSYEDARSRGLEGYDPQVLADAKAWAKDQYEQHFQNSPKLSEAPVVCGSILNYGASLP